MPTYEYKCERCEKVFEVRQKFADEPLTAHEECGGAVHRLISAPAFQFKGSGWYITDYGRAGASKDKESAKNESKPESKSESKSDSKADSNGSKSTASESKTSETSSKSETKSESSTK